MAPAVTRAEAERRFRELREAYASEIRFFYSNAEIRLLEKLKNQLSIMDADDDAWAKRKLSEIKKLNKSIKTLVGTAERPDVSKMIENSYDAGDTIGTAELQAADLLTPEISAYKRGASIKALAQATSDAINGAHLQLLRATSDGYRKIIGEVSSAVLTGTDTRVQAAQYALDRFADSGLNTFVDIAGRRWNLASYAEMAVRTGTQRASVNGHLDKLQAAGKDLVVVSDSPEECELCAAWEGKVLSISGNSEGYPTIADAEAGGLFHPNCTHRTYLYIDGVSRGYENTGNPDGYEERQTQRYLERGIRKWALRDTVAETPEAKLLAKAKLKEWKTRMKEFASETGRRRKPERERIGAAR